MALTPDIILNKGQLLVTLAYSGEGVTSEGSQFVFGYVEMVYDGCTKTEVGRKVYFPFVQARQILYGSTMFFLVDEIFSLFKEPTPP
jgi:hypothetical protein